MLTQVRLCNVRLFGNETRVFSLAPLTIFCGTNSSGKSTVLKVLPLIRQSQGIRESAEQEPGSLRLRGSQADLGTYTSFVSERDSTRNLTVGLRIKDVMPNTIFEMLLDAAQGKKSQKSNREPNEVQFLPYEVDCDFNFSPTQDKRHAPTADDPSSLYGSLKRAEVTLWQSGVKLLNWTLERIELEPSACLYKLSMPDWLLELGSSDSDLPRLESAEGTVSVVCSLKGLLASTIISAEEKYARRWPLPFIIEFAQQDFRQALLEIHYVAPLRAPAKRYYIAEAETTSSMDPTGEFVPWVLRDFPKKLVRNWIPSANPEPVEQSLETALSFWLRYLRTGSCENSMGTQTEFSLSRNGIALEVNLRSPCGSTNHSLADSGFGYSQIVPIIVRTLLAPKDATIVVEQPELHLHPDLQVRVAEFFVAMSLAGKQIIIETHSEHLVNAVRVKIAENPTAELSGSTKIYFLSTESESPKAYDLSLRPDGTLSEWPSGFLNEALELSARLLRAQKAHRKAEHA